MFLLIAIKPPLFVEEWQGLTLLKPMHLRMSRIFSGPKSYDLEELEVSFVPVHTHENTRIVSGQ
jgi:hypothetical protein